MGKKVFVLKFSELDAVILLEALGDKQIRFINQKLSTKAIEVLVDRVYRAMGVRLDK